MLGGLILERGLIIERGLILEKIRYTNYQKFREFLTLVKSLRRRKF